MAEPNESGSAPATGPPADPGPGDQGPADPGPADPVAAEPVASRRSSMSLRLVGVAAALVLTLAVALAAVVLTGPPSVEDLRRRAGMDKKQELLVGVKDDQPGVAFHDTANDAWSGFDIDIAYMVAEDLGFRRTEVRFLAIESEDRARMQATDNFGNPVTVDLVVASYSITAERRATAGVTFSAPYLFTEQSVMTLKSHRPVAGLEELRGQRVCSLATSTSVNAVDKVRAIRVTRNKISDCFKALDRNETDAVSTDAAILAGFKARNVDKYEHYDIGLEATEAWGINVGENDALRDLVNLTLYRSQADPADDRWEDAFEKNLRPEIDKNRGAPIAVGQQPKVKDKPDVREWPWERIEE